MLRQAVVFRILLLIALLCALLLPAKLMSSLLAQGGTVEVAVDTSDFNQDGLLVLFSALRRQGMIGLPIGAGDINGDNRSDVVICGMYGSGGAGNRRHNGQVNFYLSDGRDSGFIDQVTEPNRFQTLVGADSGDLLGSSVATGDVNNDGYQDVLIGAFGDDGIGNGRFNSGAAYLVLGRPDFALNADLFNLDGTPPPGIIAFYGSRENGRTGVWVDMGDVNGDGFDDLVMGADQISKPDAQHVGGACVVFGSPSLPQVIDLAAPPAGVEMVRIIGANQEDHWGAMLHVGDLNNDGIKDVVMGGSIFRDSGSFVTEQDQTSGHNDFGASFDGTRNRCGETMVLYGSQNWPPVINLAAPPANSTRVIGANIRDLLGSQLHSGDLNGDGFRDLIIGALQALAPDNRGRTGAVHVVYGSQNLPGKTIDFANPEASGLRTTTIYGIDNLDCAGDSVRAFDINNDGLSDLFIGSPEHSFPINGGMRQRAGDTKFLFGRRAFLPAVVKLYAPPADLKIYQLAGAHGQGMGLDEGPDAGDEFSYRLAGGDVDGDGFVDYISNAMHGDGFGSRLLNAGNVYIFSGKKLSAKLGMLVTEPPDAPELNTATLSINGQAVQQTPAGQNGIRLTINGANFRDDTQVLINGEVVVSRLPNNEQLRATQRIVDLDDNPTIKNSVITLRVRVRNSNPPSDPSNEITAGRLTGPEIANVTLRRKSAKKLVFTISGANFQTGMTVSLLDQNSLALPIKTLSVNSSTSIKGNVKTTPLPAPGSIIRVRVLSGAVQSNEVSVPIN